jgi:hypothetical protein
MPFVIPWRSILKFGLPLLLILGALWFIDHRGYQRAEDKYKLEKAEADARALEANRLAEQRSRKLEQVMQGVVTEVDEKLGVRLTSLDVLKQTIIQPTLTKEILSDPRYSNPDAGISVGMLDTLNTARAATNPACTSTANGGLTCPLPAAQPAEGSLPRHSGE